MNEYVGFIYEWTNSENGKKYIGSHKGTIDDGYIGSGLAFNHAIKKYGIEKFNRTILEYVSDVNNISTVEQYYLDLFECALSKDYYNVSFSATGGNMGQDYKENGKKIALTNKERGHYKQASIRMKENNPNKGGQARREYNKINGAPNIGYKHTDEAKQLFREQKLGDNNPNKDGKARLTVTYLLDPDTKEIVHTFNSLKEAEATIKANHASVYYNRQRNRPHKGFYWCVGKEELKRITNESIR